MYEMHFVYTRSSKYRSYNVWTKDGFVTAATRHIISIINHLINHANPLWPNWVTESAVSGGKGPQKSWRNNIRVRVRALTVMDIETRVRTGLPRGEVTERCEDQDEGKGPRRYGPCSLCRCVLHRG